MEFSSLEATLKLRLPERRERIATAILVGFVARSSGSPETCIQDTMKMTDLLIEALDAKRKQESDAMRSRETGSQSSPTTRKFNLDE
jgi:hypothetical protein